MFCILLVTPMNMCLWPVKFSFVAMAILIASSTIRSELISDKSSRRDRLQCTRVNHRHT